MRKLGLSGTRKERDREKRNRIKPAVPFKARVDEGRRMETLKKLPFVAMQPSNQKHHPFKAWDNIGTQCLWCWGFVDDWRHLAHPTSA